MKKIDKHFLLSLELDNRLKIISEEKNITYTYLVEKLLQKGIDNEYELKKIEKLETELIYLKNKINLILDLLMQIYADMDFDNIKDIKNSKALKTFFRKRNDLNYDD